MSFIQYYARGIDLKFDAYDLSVLKEMLSTLFVNISSISTHL